MAASEGMRPDEVESGECWDAAKVAALPSAMKESLNCCICLGLLRDAVSLRCGHSFGHVRPHAAEKRGRADEREREGMQDGERGRL